MSRSSESLFVIIRRIAVVHLFTVRLDDFEGSVRDAVDGARLSKGAYQVRSHNCQETTLITVQQCCDNDLITSLETCVVVIVPR